MTTKFAGLQVNQKTRVAGQKTKGLFQDELEIETGGFRNVQKNGHLTCVSHHWQLMLQSKSRFLIRPAEHLPF